MTHLIPRDKAQLNQGRGKVRPHVVHGDSQNVYLLYLIVDPFAEGGLDPSLNGRGPVPCVNIA